MLLGVCFNMILYGVRHTVVLARFLDFDSALFIGIDSSG